jgi:hypothetical protein
MRYLGILNAIEMRYLGILNAIEMRYIGLVKCNWDEIYWNS